LVRRHAGAGQWQRFTPQNNPNCGGGVLVASADLAYAMFSAIPLRPAHLDDLHQWECVQNHRLVRENERLRVLLAKIRQQRETWKVRALMGEAQLRETSTRRDDKGNGQHVTDLRYASLKRYLAKQFHPDFAPGQGIEKIVRSEIFKEVWNEIERLDQTGSDGALRPG
jgi:hypothetical protein